MPAEKYLCHVNSGAIGPVTNDLWRDFYTTEHLPDVVNSGCAVQALLYEEIPTPFLHPADNPRNFLAVYQSKYTELMKAECHDKIRATSGMFSQAESTTDRINRNGDFEVRNYELVQEYDPLEVGEAPSPHLVTVETQPDNDEGCDRWYREEHLDMLRRLPGYHRSLRYKIGPRWEFAQHSPPRFLAMHQVDDIAAVAGEQGMAAGSTTWGQRQLGGSEVLAVRGWKLVLALGC